MGVAVAVAVHPQPVAIAEAFIVYTATSIFGSNRHLIS